MPCTCRECLELAARGANVELLRCVAQDPLSPPGQGGNMGSGEIIAQAANLGQQCPIQRVQIVPFGLDEVSASELEDPDNRAYIWELSHGRHFTHDHEHCS